METSIEVEDRSQVAQVRRMVAALSATQGLSPEDRGRAELVATEASTNLVKYGRHGSVAVSRFDEWGASGVQIVATDRGPGIANFAASARDGHSTGGSLGIGLGAIIRASDLFDVYTVEAQGSALLSRVYKGVAPQPPEGALVTGARTTPKLGQQECGDAWCHARAGRWQRICVVDGLGHGPLAASASAHAIAVCREAREKDTPMDILAAAHEALRGTRGAVMGVASIDTNAGQFSFCGVGNISGVLYAGDKSHHLLSVEGIVGYNARNLKLQELPWSRDCTLILSSDGLSTRRNMTRYPGLLQRHPALVASVMYRDYARDADDACVVVARGGK